MPRLTDPNVLVDLSTCDDAAVYRVSEDVAVVLTVDFITPVVDDAYEFGRIAVTNALSDIYAMGARPVVALNLVAYPSKTRPLDDLEAILKGGADQATAAGVSIVGGHSIDDPEPKYGLAAMGVVNPADVVTNAGAKPGDRVILTKPLGLGIATTAMKTGACPEKLERQSVRVMTTLNKSASEVMKRVGCSACTDVTGFGLLGHLRELTSASGVGATLNADAVPTLPGVDELARQDLVPGGSEKNLEFLETSGAVVWEGDLPDETKLILCDAQTAGGLLISVPAQRSAELIAALRDAQTLAAADIGEIVSDSECRVFVKKEQSV